MMPPPADTRPDPAALAALHARAFVTPPPWTAAAFAATLADPAAFALLAPGALLIGRAVADEAELLTLATDPALRRQGHARALLARFDTEARARGAQTAFLEVAEDNATARALYAACGWDPAGRRPNYYPLPGGGRVAALVLRRALA
jgi:[ribosomal protein S18]-alanine N-acetyltransferase